MKITFRHMIIFHIANRVWLTKLQIFYDILHILRNASFSDSTMNNITKKKKQDKKNVRIIDIYNTDY